MTTTSKIALSTLMASAVALSSTQAGVIQGTISFGGNVNVYTGANATGSTPTDYSGADSIKILGATTAGVPAPSMSFANVSSGTGVTFSYNIINLTGTLGGGALSLPVPTSTPLWSVTDSLGTTFQFVLSTLTEAALQFNPVTGKYDTMTLTGTGTISDNKVGDTANSSGTWTATFNSASAGGPTTFSWSSSSAAPISSVPETGTGLMLLGLGLAALAGYSQFRKQVA